MDNEDDTYYAQKHEIFLGKLKNICKKIMKKVFEHRILKDKGDVYSEQIIIPSVKEAVSFAAE